MKESANVNMLFKQFPSADDLATSLAECVAELLNEEIKSNGSATLAVSGGRSPIAFFKKLSVANLPWKSVLVTLIDERWVDNDHSDSNEKLVRQHLLRENAKEAFFLPLKNSASTAADGQDKLQRSLAELPENITVSILGMGEDGHTASFFPGADTLEQALCPKQGVACQFVNPLTAPHERMTLTLPRILASKQIFLQLSGEVKKAVYEKALYGDDPVSEMPVKSVLLQQETPVSVYWTA